MTGAAATSAKNAQVDDLASLQKKQGSPEAHGPAGPDMTRRIRAGDTVLHRPSGETWWVAYADYETGELSAWGWPDSIARISDCEPVCAASDEKHLREVAEYGARDDRRGRHIRRLYGTTEPSP